MNQIRKLLLVRSDDSTRFVFMVEAGTRTLSYQIPSYLAEEVIDVVLDKIAELKTNGRLLSADSRVRAKCSYGG